MDLLVACGVCPADNAPRIVDPAARLRVLVTFPYTASLWVFFIESSIMASLYFQREMEALNPKSAEELKEEQEEREFLNGGQSHEHKEHQHH